MKNIVTFFGIFLFVFTLAAYADVQVVTDVQDANNWGDYFLPAGANPHTQPYYRYGNRNFEGMSNGIYGNGNWGWTHTPDFGGWVDEASDIISATLTIDAWDVGPDEYDLIYGDNLYLGCLELDNDYKWNKTTFNLDDKALSKLIDGKLDISMLIDVGTSPSCFAVTLRSSTLSVNHIGYKPDDPNETSYIYKFKPVDCSCQTYDDTGDLISQLGVEQAWFGFDVSDVPRGQMVVAAYLSAKLCDFDGEQSQRTIWYTSDDSWIDTANPDSSDPGVVPGEELIGEVLHENVDYTNKTVEIKHDWAQDLVDNLVSIMVSGPFDGSYQAGAIDMDSVQLKLITVDAPVNPRGQM